MAMNLEELTAEQAEEWRAVVSTMPVGWFGRESYLLLASLALTTVWVPSRPPGGRQIEGGG